MGSITDPNEMKPCSRLSTFKGFHGANAYKSIPGAQTPMLRCCCSCADVGPRLYHCLDCSKTHCFGHSAAHQESNTMHKIALDVERSELCCFSCGDQVYDDEFDAKIRRSRRGGRAARRRGREWRRALH